MSLKRRSSLVFGSLLSYATKGDRHSEEIQRNHEVTAAIKNDKVIFAKELGPDYLARVFESCCQGTDLDGFIPPDAILVPLPRSSPLKPGTFWPAWRIAEALVSRGIGSKVEAFLERTTATLSSSRAGGERIPERHFQTSCMIASDLFIFESEVPLVLIDDFIGSGATALGMAWHIDTLFPNADLRLFAVSHAKEVAGQPIQTLHPMKGIITFDCATAKASRQP